MLNILGLKAHEKKKDEEGPFCAIHDEFHHCHKIILSTDRLLKKETVEDLKNTYVDVLYKQDDR